MKHIVALILKLIAALVLLEVMLSLLTVLPMGRIALIALAVTVVSYLVGDLLILAFSNNTAATVCDIVLTFTVIYLFNYWPGFEPISVTAAVICTLILAVAEIFFHRYMVRMVYPNRTKGHT
jgi:hypothetical protein